MKTSVLKALIFTLSVLTAMGSTAHASGDGRSGDDHAGIAIPTSIDHAIEYKDFEYAVSYCVDKAAASLFNQMTRLKLPNPPTILSKSTNLANYAFVANGKSYGFGFRVGMEFEGLDLTTASGFQLVKLGNDVPNAIRLIVDDSVDQMLMNAGEDKGSFSGGLDIKVQTKKDSGYDELGSFRKESLIVSKYEVIASPIVRKLENGQTKVTSLRLDAKQFTQCLQYNLEKDQ